MHRFKQVISVMLMALTLAFAFAPASVSAHPDEEELLREMEELYGRNRPSAKPPEAEEAPPPPPPLLETIGAYIVIGYEHILPKGLDHILFVLGLFFASTRFRPLLIQVTSFTVAHTVTLALAILGLVNLPASIVEPLIALSIAYVAVENIIFKNKMTPWRPVIVFGFGLLHGLGFAGVLMEIGMPEGQFIPGLISFNVGVELGQLSVILIAFGMLSWLYEKPWYRSRVMVPVSLAIAATGLYWTVERVFF